MQREEYRFAVLGGDARQTWLVRALREKGHTAGTLGVPDTEDTAPDAAAVLAAAECVILPMPAFSGDCVTGSRIPADSVLAALRPGMAVFGGLLGDWTEPLWDTGARIADYARDEQLAAANAVPTAEGAIRLAMEGLPVTLQGSRCLVVGFGRIGKLLSLKLRALGAEVTAAARSPRDLGLISSLGLEAEQTGVYVLPLSRYDVIFNTVPATVFDRAQLAEGKGALWIDLASSPGGIDPELCRALGVQIVAGRGLPGRCAPAAAGRIILDTVLRLLSSS